MYDNQQQFSIALKAAAWEAQTLFRQGGNGGRSQCVRQAARNLDLADETKPIDNVDQTPIREAIYVLAFREPDLPAVDHHLTVSWMEYAGMGRKASYDHPDDMPAREQHRHGIV